MNVRNFEEVIEKSKKRIFEGAKYQRKFALNGTKYERKFAKLSHAKFRSKELSAKIRVQWNETTVKFRKIDKLVVFFGTKRSTTPAVLLTEITPKN